MKRGFFWGSVLILTVFSFFYLWSNRKKPEAVKRLHFPEVEVQPMSPLEQALLSAGPDVESDSTIYRIRGELLRFKKSKAGGWNSSLTLADEQRRQKVIQVQSGRTSVQDGDEMKSLDDLVSGMKLTILYRKDESGHLRATFIRIQRASIHI